MHQHHLMGLSDDSYSDFLTNLLFVSSLSCEEHETKG